MLRLVRADLHNHLGTRILKDNKHGFDKVIDFASSRLGPGGLLGVVNFYETIDYPIYETLLPMRSKYHKLIFDWGFFVPEKDLTVVRGEEVPAVENGYEAHLLMLGTPAGHRTQPYKNLDETILEGRSVRGIIVADHPFYRMGILRAIGESDRERRDKVLHSLDAMEIHNGEAVLIGLGQFANSDASAFYSAMHSKFPNLGALISSDGHSLNEIGSSYTYLELPAYFNRISSEDMKVELLKSIVDNPHALRGKAKRSTFAATKHSIRVFRDLGFKGTKAKLTRS